MLQTATKVIQWISIPVLLIASLFGCCIPSYEVAVDWGICLGAAILIPRALASQEYFWAGAVVALAAAFTPFSLIVKIFLLMGVTCVAILMNLVRSFRRQSVPVV